MAKATSKTIMISWVVVFFVIASYAPLFASLAEALQECRSSTDCRDTADDCPSGTAFCHDGKCLCRHTEAKMSVLKNENHDQCSTKIDCDRINLVCPSGNLECVNGECKCLGVAPVLPQRLEPQSGQDGECVVDTDCYGIYKCPSGILKCVNRLCDCEPAF